MGIERFVGAVLFNVRKYAFKSLQHKTKFMICIIKICIHYRFDYCSQSLIHVINIYSFFIKVFHCDSYHYDIPIMKRNLDFYMRHVFICVFLHF